MGLGFSEILLIFFAIILLFGAKRIPELARALGKASREFNNARNGITEELQNAEKPAQTNAPATPAAPAVPAEKAQTPPTDNAKKS